MREAKANYYNRDTESWIDLLLTSDHAASSNGQPVLVAAGVAHGPGDILLGSRVGNSPAEAKDNVTAREFVAERRNSFVPIDDDPAIFYEDGVPSDQSIRSTFSR